MSPSSPSGPFVLHCRELACRSSLERAAWRELARIERLDIGVVGCSVRIDVPGLSDRHTLPEGVCVELQAAGGCILTTTGAVRRHDLPEDVANEIRRCFVELERRLWRLRAARAARAAHVEAAFAVPSAAPSAAPCAVGSPPERTAVSPEPPGSRGMVAGRAIACARWCAMFRLGDGESPTSSEVRPRRTGAKC